VQQAKIRLKPAQARDGSKFSKPKSKVTNTLQEHICAGSMQQWTNPSIFRLHRERKANYAKFLEQEVVRLRQADASTRKEQMDLEAQNAVMRSFLAPYETDLPPLQISGHHLDHALPDSVSVNIHYDPVVAAERFFVDLPPQHHPPLPAIGEHTLTTLFPPTTTPDLTNDTSIILDFILA